jgi:hypothetical protein
MSYINDIYSNKAFHWLMFLKYNNLGFLKLESLNKPPHKVDSDNSEESIEAYRDINDQIINCFGIEESFEAQKKAEEDIAKLKLDFIINGNKMKRTEWRLKEAELQTPEDHNKKQYDLEKEIEIVSKSVGSGIIDIKKHTIHQYLIAKNSLKNGK